MPITGGSTPPPVRKPSASPAEQKASKTEKARTEAINGFGQLFQLPLLITGLHADAGAIGMHWPNIASEVAKLAETQPAVAKIVDPLLQAGPYAGLITAVLPLVVQIGVNHGRIQAGAMGSVPGSMLDAQVKTQMAKAELQALQMQQQAEAEAKKIRDQIASAKTQVVNDAV